jgi:hypothetical protein
VLEAVPAVPYEIQCGRYGAGTKGHSVKVAAMAQGMKGLNDTVDVRMTVKHGRECGAARPRKTGNDEVTAHT